LCPHISFSLREKVAEGRMGGVRLAENLAEISSEAQAYHS
jgi:hypothetical protein